MTKARHCLAAMGVLFTLATTPSFAVSTEQYLKTRSQYAFDSRLIYAVVQASPATYVNKVLELKGTVDGYVRKENAISFLLSTPDQNGLMLTAPAADEAVVTSGNHQTLRVLVLVGEGATGNVVPLTVLAVAYDAPVTAREREAPVPAARPAAASRSGQVQRKASSTPNRSARQTASRGSSPIVPANYGGHISALARRSLTPEGQAVYPVYREYIRTRNKRLTEGELDLITVCVLHSGIKYRVDPRLVIALIIAESDFNPRVVSHKGCIGLGQLSPGEIKANKLSNPYDPYQNIDTAVSLLRLKLEKYRKYRTPTGTYTVDQIKLALAAYNAGPGAVKKYGGVPPYRETQGYIKKILKIYTELTAGDRTI